MRIPMSINTDFVIATRGGAEHEYVMAITGLMFAPGGMVIKSGNRLNRAVISRKQFDSEPMRDVLPGEIDVN